MSLLICFKRSFIWAQSRCSSSRRLEMTCVWRWYAIFENGENEVHWFHLEPKRIRTHSNISWHYSWTKRATLVRLVLNESSFKYLWDCMMFSNALNWFDNDRSKQKVCLEWLSSSVTGMEKNAQKQQWHDTTYELDKLYGSIPKLMEAVIAAGGSHTK